MVSLAADLFICVEISMPQGPFLPSDFTATEFSSAADKAEFGNAFLHFIDSNWKQALFTEKFYNRLSKTFGHIAHYDRPTFYATWFTCDADSCVFSRTRSAGPVGVILHSPSVMWSLPFSARSANGIASLSTN
jgi:hypothetical protein